MKDKTALLLSYGVIILILFFIYKHHEYANASGLNLRDVSSSVGDRVLVSGTRVIEQASGEENLQESISDIKSNIKTLQEEIIELEKVEGTGVGVYALILNDNIEDLKRIRTELKVKKDGLTYQSRPCESWNILSGVFADTECQIIDSVSSETVGKAVISVMVAESGGGKHLCGTYNPMGIMKNGRCENFTDVDNFIQVGIKKRVGGYFNRLEKCGVNKECLDLIFVGKGKYCSSSCSNWTSNVYLTYGKLGIL
jgi:hypothetical protein